MATELLTRLLFIVPFLVVGFVLELALHDRPRVDWRARRLNLGLTVIYIVADVVASATLALGVFWLVTQLPWHGVIGSWLPAIPDATIPMGLAAVGYLLLSDFFYYWMHRAQHRIWWLWVEHAVHHSDPDVNVTTNYRHHWLDKPLGIVLIFGPLSYLLTPPSRVLAMTAVMQALVGHFIHLDARIGLGSGNWALANPQHHRIHHSREARHRDRNFAAVWPVWDIVFGTYYRPAPHEYPATGMDDAPPARTVWAASAAPFRVWRQALQARLAGR